MKHLGHLGVYPLCIYSNVIFLVKCSISKVYTVHNVGSKLNHSLRRCPVIDALLDKYLAHKKRSNFKMLLFRLIYSKPLD